MGGNHSENGDHRHVEPRRELTDQPFPESVVLYRYPGSTPGQDPGAGIKTLVRREEISRALYPGNMEGINQDLTTVHPSPPLMGGSSSHEEDPPNEVLAAKSVLFVPIGLETEDDFWEELSDNDVTVNWLGLDPDFRGSDQLPRARALSDWVIGLDDGFSRAQAAGLFTGVFHLVQEQVQALYDEVPLRDWTILNRWIDETNVKFRPNLIHGPDWELPLESDDSRSL